MFMYMEKQIESYNEWNPMHPSLSFRKYQLDVIISCIFHVLFVCYSILKKIPDHVNLCSTKKLLDISK